MSRGIKSETPRNQSGLGGLEDLVALRTFRRLGIRRAVTVGTVEPERFALHVRDQIACWAIAILQFCRARRVVVVGDQQGSFHEMAPRNGGMGMLRCRCCIVKYVLLPHPPNL